MTYPCVSRATLHESNALCNKYTVDAIESAGFDCQPVSEGVVNALLVYSQTLRPNGQPLSEFLAGEVTAEAIRAAQRPSANGRRTVDLPRLKCLAWSIANRLQARELKVRFRCDLLSNEDAMPDTNWEQAFRLVELESALEAATANLVDSGEAREGVIAVILHFLGWSTSQIASRSGQKAESVRKRIYRLKSRVRAELRWQFIGEVA